MEPRPPHLGRQALPRKPHVEDDGPRRSSFGAKSRHVSRMLRSFARAVIAVALAVAASGCFAQPGDGIFGPASSLGGLDDGSRPIVSVKATPARGAPPLAVEFTVGARDSDEDMGGWWIDFGDGSPWTNGTTVPAKILHTY